MCVCVPIRAYLIGSVKINELIRVEDLIPVVVHAFLTESCLELMIDVLTVMFSMKD